MNYTRIENLTVDQYQQLYVIHTSEDDILEKAIASISILTNKPRWEVEEIPMVQFKQMSREIAILFSNQEIKPKVVRSVKVNGQKYAVILNPRKLIAGQYIDLQHFLRISNTKEKLIENLHKFMASLLIPVKYSPLNIRGKYDGKNHDAISQGVRSLKFSEVHSTCLFFSKLWNSSIKVIHESLIKEVRRNQKNKIQGVQLTETDLQNILAGFTVLNR